MQHHRFAILALGLAIALAGCTSPPPPADDGSGTPSGGTGGTGGNTTAPPRGGNTTGPGGSGGNTTGPGGSGGSATPPPPPAPTSVHDASYSWTVQPPAAATFTVPAGFRNLNLAANVTDATAVGVSMTIELVDPAGTSVGSVTLNPSPASPNPSGTLDASAVPGDYALNFGGNGVGSVQVTVMAS